MQLAPPWPFFCYLFLPSLAYIINMDTVGFIRWDYADANTDLGTNDIKSIAGAGLIVGVVVELLIIGDDC